MHRCTMISKFVEDRSQKAYSVYLSRYFAAIILKGGYLLISTIYDCLNVRMI